MKVCMIGDYSGNIEEGMRNVAFHLKNEMSKRHDILALDINEIFSLKFWVNVRRFNPQIIHYIPGPSFSSFFIVKLMKAYCENAKTVMSATHPTKNLDNLSIFINWIKPDLMLTQSEKTHKMFSNMGLECRNVPNGVDINKFYPASPEIKAQLRLKYNVGIDKFVILHVGSIKKGRGIEVFKNLQNETIQVIVVGPKSMGIEKQILDELEEVGCITITDFLKDIEELYHLSDCYVFPTPPNNTQNSIELPLSVFEAMACNLPIVTMKYGGLADLLARQSGLYFVETEKEIISIINTLKNNVLKPNTREQVLRFSWGSIARQVELEFYNLVS